MVIDWLQSNNRRRSGEKPWTRSGVGGMRTHDAHAGSATSIVIPASPGIPPGSPPDPVRGDGAGTRMLPDPCKSNHRQHRRRERLRRLLREVVADARDYPAPVLSAEEPLMSIGPARRYDSVTASLQGDGGYRDA